MCANYPSVPDIKSLLVKNFSAGNHLYLIKTEANYEHHQRNSNQGCRREALRAYRLPVAAYSIVNDALTRVHASIRKKDADGSGNAPQIGIGYMEQGVISCSIPMGEPSTLFHDFDYTLDRRNKKSNVQNA
ncbi:hypothetical protein NXW09_29395 [Bacteroides ovatus]|nr:hypothetical protein [Bacteroides ovatus]